MKNSCFLTKAQLSVAAAICGSVAASVLHILGYLVAAIVVQGGAIAALGLAMFWIAKTAGLIRQAKEVCKRIAAGDFEARILSIPEMTPPPSCSLPSTT